MHTDKIEIDDAVFIEGRTEAFGAVRSIHRGAHPSLRVWVENHGEVELDGACVRRVHEGKVEVAFDGLPADLQQHIRQAHDAES